MNNSLDLSIGDDCLGYFHNNNISQHNIINIINTNQQLMITQQESCKIYLSHQKRPKKSKQQNEAHILNRRIHKNNTIMRDKVVLLIDDDEMEQQVEGNGDICGDGLQSLKGKGVITRDQQLRRNRQSAKHSRQRRKQYIRSLQQKNEQNTRQIQQLTQKLREIQLQRDRLKQQNRSYMKRFMTTKNEVYENLTIILNKNGKKSNEKLSQQLQILIGRYGVYGTERIAVIDYLMKQIVQMLLADIHKYIVDCVQNNYGLFGLGEWRRLDDEICTILKINKQQRIKLSKNYQQQMRLSLQSYKQAIKQFYKRYQLIKNEAKKLQKQFQRIYIQFNDVYIVQLILWLQSNKYSKDIKIIRTNWLRSIQSNHWQWKNNHISYFQNIYQS